VVLGFFWVLGSPAAVLVVCALAWGTFTDIAEANATTHNATMLAMRYSAGKKRDMIAIRSIEIFITFSIKNTKALRRQ